MSILIKNAQVGQERLSIRIEGERISEMGNLSGDAEHIIDAEGMLALPGLVNCHTHAAMTLLRGFADDMPLQPWLEEKIWPQEAKLTPELVHTGTKLACLEMIKTGTTTFHDMYFFMEQTAKAVDAMGLRAVLGYGFIDLFDQDKREQEIKATMDLVKTIRSMDNSRITPDLAPHALYTVSKEGLQWVREFSDEQDLVVHFHLSETEHEVQECMEKNGKPPIKYLDEIGFLSDKLVAAHCVWLSEPELELMAKHGATAVHNPVSNMKLSVGEIMPYPQMRRLGINVALGTDGTASNNNLDMFEEMKFAAVLQKLYNPPTTLPVEEAITMATWNGAKALNLDSGIIQEGKLADIILISKSCPSMTPMHNATSNIVYAGNGCSVDTTICNGRILMKGGMVEGEAQIIKEAQEAAVSLVSD